MAENSKFADTKAFKIASIAILTAIVAIFTIVVRFPIAPTRGYLNLGDVAIFFTAFTFGPISAFIAGGVGTALADILVGYGHWAPISFVAHGLQGLFVGFVYIFLKKSNYNIFLNSLICFIVGSLFMVSAYFIASIFMTGIGAAVVEIPGNILQNIAGVIGGLFLSSSVKKAYPPVINFRW